MAGDWIKIELDLPDKPEVHHIAAALGLDPDAVVGKLHRVWAWFDKHTEDGNALGVTFALVDRLVFAQGFAEAMASCGWLEQNGNFLSIPNFDRHNGKTAKTRALTAKRAAEHRQKSNAVSNAKRNGESVTQTAQSALPREEKIKEPPKAPQGGDSGFSEFWTTYPKKTGKGAAEKSWRKLKPNSELRATILAAIERQKSWPQWQRDNGQYIPNPQTWLNQRRWEDEPPDTPAKSNGRDITGLVRQAVGRASSGTAPTTGDPDVDEAMRKVGVRRLMDMTHDTRDALLGQVQAHYEGRA